jgi:hypothetical protein
MLELVVDNWKPFPKQQIIKKIPTVLRNTGDNSVIALQYSVRSRFTSDLKIWYLIKKEEGCNQLAGTAETKQ